MKKSDDDKLEIICLFHGLYVKQKNKSSNPFVGLFSRFLTAFTAWSFASNSIRKQVDEEPLCGCATSKSSSLLLLL